jgi:uncharacterized protein YgbK (DUF1537 family)
MTALRDPQQPMRALALANDVRTHIADFKHEIAALPQHEAVVRVIDAIENRHGEKLLGAARVRYLLIGIARIGDEKARKILMIAEIYNQDKRLRDLTARQRTLLVSVLERCGWRG